MARQILLSPRIKITRNHFRENLLRLGSSYGGWTFLHSGSLSGATIVSCGLGEDASFDIEFATKYQAKIVIVDPTPRAIIHFKKILERLGQTSERAYSSDGCQPVSAYDLSSITADNLTLIEKAAWTNTGKLRFYTPPNPAYVSHSLVNFQNNYSTTTPYIEVECTTIDNIASAIGLLDIPLMKLDIEGAEIPVLRDMFEKGIYPGQLLIEFDELTIPSVRSYRSFRFADQLLHDSGYGLCYFDNVSNFLYVHKDFAVR